MIMKTIGKMLEWLIQGAVILALLTGMLLFYSNIQEENASDEGQRRIAVNKARQEEEELLLEERLSREAQQQRIEDDAVLYRQQLRLKDRAKR